MCGIAGLLHHTDDGLVKRMTNAIHHRGPDSEGFFAQGPVSLGMRRLSVIDLESGDQPVFNENQQVVVVYNGEIYNYRELTQSLRAKGHRFSTNSDTEVLVHLYEEKGLDMVQDLNGMFAFALWDGERRDRDGQKAVSFWQILEIEK